MRIIKTCIFDLDGVIVDTAKYHYMAWKETARELGFDFTENDNERLKGVSRMASLEILLSVGKIKLSDEEKEYQADKKNKYYQSLIAGMKPDEILHGAYEFIELVRNAGLKTALGSASKNAMTILNRLNLTQLFDAVIDGSQVINAKPNPEIFLKAAKALNMDVAQCIVFEDAQAGVDAAHAAGMKCVGIGSPDVLKNADLIVSGLDKMLLGMIEENF
ncbi:MAG: beta-phosphoglucomutase [Cytophagaceae bacterium]|nr:beta-phosphoglucomutase [Cytophagaceae bacterium]